MFKPPFIPLLNLRIKVMQEVKDLYEGLSLFSDKLNHKKKYYNHMSRAKS